MKSIMRNPNLKERIWLSAAYLDQSYQRDCGAHRDDVVQHEVLQPQVQACHRQREAEADQSADVYP
jgi:hypothetical protein